jgi:peptide/nickel transport system permease protein
MSAYRYLAKRMGQAVFTVFAVITVTFFLIRLIPGGPMDYYRSILAQQSASGGARMDIADQLEEYINVNPDKPLEQQYVDYLFAILQGDFGKSFWYDEPVADIVVEALPWTVFVVMLAVIGSFAAGITIGALMALWERGRFDATMTAASIGSLTVPYYVFALVFLGTFAYTYGILPVGGRYNAEVVTPGLNLDFFVNALVHAIMPVLSLQVAMFGGRALAMRGNSIQVLGSDYVRVARLRGLSWDRIATRYVARNAILPLYTGFLITIAILFSGSVVLEQIFSYPGIAYHLFVAFEARDYQLMMAIFIIITTVTVIALLVADMTYSMIDPRIKTGEEA